MGMNPNNPGRFIEGVELARYVFVVGTPGSGKSVFCRNLGAMLEGRGYITTKIGDYPFLQELFEEEKKAGHPRQWFREDEISQFEVINDEAYVEALRRLYRKKLKEPTKKNEIRIVEFARPRYDTAFLHATIEHLSKSIIVHILAPVSKCTDRNNRRGELLEQRRRVLEAEKTGDGPFVGVGLWTDPDLHKVPDSIMKRYESENAQLEGEQMELQTLVLSLLPARAYVRLDNSKDDKDNSVPYSKKIEEAVSNKIMAYFAVRESYREYFNRRYQELTGLLKGLQPSRGNNLERK